jgi:RNA polymerase sigma-70 factor (ECF subfamily)
MDRKSLVALKRGKPEGLESIYRLLSGRVYNFVLSMLHDPDIAKDLTQDVFIHLWEKRESIVCELNVEGYIFRMVRNIVYQHIRRALLLEEILQQIESIESDEDEHNPAEKNVDAELIEALILKLITELPEARRRIFLLYWQSRLNYREIAEQLSVSEKTVATQVQRSLHFLRTKIGKVAI